MDVMKGPPILGSVCSAREQLPECTCLQRRLINPEFYSVGDEIVRAGVLGEKQSVGATDSGGFMNGHALERWAENRLQTRIREDAE